MNCINDSLGRDAREAMTVGCKSTRRDATLCERGDRPNLSRARAEIYWFSKLVDYVREAKKRTKS